MNYTLKELSYWNEKVENKGRELGLNCYPQEFDIVDYNDMLTYQVYFGMPSMYPHWSFGKSYDRLKTLYKHNIVGLPYEMVINSNPCVAYLLKENNLLMQILTMAHVYGHNDFFKNNRMFMESTKAELTLEKFKIHSIRIRDYRDKVGDEKVEKLLDKIHSIKLNVDLLNFLKDKGRLLGWEKEIIAMIIEESTYFIAQLETKIMNEGWASFWHYKLLNELQMPQGMYIEFLARHNSVIAPMKEKMNPYHLGFKIFMDIEEKYGLKKVFEVRILERDESFIRRYLSEELCEDMNLFQYKTDDKNFIIEEVCHDDGWKAIKNTLCKNAGLNSIPRIRVKEGDNEGLILDHIYDGRELDLNYAGETLKNIHYLWKGKTVLKTQLNGKAIEIICSKDGEISYV